MRGGPGGCRRSNRPGFDHHEGLRPGVIVGQRDVHDGLVPRRRHRGEPLGRPAGQLHLRLAGAQVGHRHVFPADPHPQPGAERLGTGLLRGPALGIGARHIGAALGLGLFDLGEHAVAEPVAVAIEHALDALDIREIGADTEDHVVTKG